jgi:nitrate reductase beta subunit
MSVFAGPEAESKEVETYEFPLSIEDEHEIKRRLRQREVFAPSFIPQDEDVYDPLMYQRQNLHHDTNTVLLIDMTFPAKRSTNDRSKKKITLAGALST